MSEESKCEICGELMPQGETMFKFHGYSGPCPKPPLLQPHQQRVVTEKADLDEKIAKLGTFMLGETFGSLDGAEQSRLFIQQSAMKTYSMILGERIKAFAG